MTLYKVVCIKRRSRFNSSKIQETSVHVNLTKEKADDAAKTLNERNTIPNCIYRVRLQK